jgi:hypothetical protein
MSLVELNRHNRYAYSPIIATARRAKIRPISLKALILKRPICQILAV